MEAAHAHEICGCAGRVRDWFKELPFAGKAGIAACFSAFIGLAAQVRIPLPFTPVPLTGQTFAVLVTGALLGGGWGGFAAGLYAAAGAAGLPWFAGWSGGWAEAAGPTGGYILGFIPAAAAVGWALGKHRWARTLPGLLLVMTAADLLLILGPGVLVLSLCTRVTAPAQLLWMGLIPFIPGDMLKITAAAAGVRILLLPGTRRRE